MLFIIKVQIKSIGFLNRGKVLPSFNSVVVLLQNYISRNSTTYNIQSDDYEFQTDVKITTQEYQFENLNLLFEFLNVYGISEPNLH